MADLRCAVSQDMAPGFKWKFVSLAGEFWPRHPIHTMRHSFERLVFARDSATLPRVRRLGAGPIQTVLNQIE